MFVIWYPMYTFKWENFNTKCSPQNTEVTTSKVFDKWLKNQLIKPIYDPISNPLGANGR